MYISLIIKKYYVPLHPVTNWLSSMCVSAHLLKRGMQEKIKG